MDSKTLKKLIVALTFLLPAIVFAQEAVQKSVSVTAFNDDFGVVREKREVELKKGVSFIRLSDIPEKINPRTVKVKLDGQVLEQNYQYDLANFSKILAKYIDKEVTLLSPNKNYTGKLVSVSGLQITLKDSAEGLIMIPDLNNFTLNVSSLPEGFVSKPTLVWKVNSNISGKAQIDISYQTQGISWNADYVAVLNEDDTEMDVNAWVTLDNNSGATYKNANLKLMAGDVETLQQTIEFTSDAIKSSVEVNEKYVETPTPPKFVQKEFMDYHIYNLDKPSTLFNGEQKQLALFTAKRVKVSKKYEAYYNFIFNDNGNQMFDDLAVSVSMEFDNSKKNNLGEPLPQGIFRVNKTDGIDEEFVGEDNIEHTPENEDVTISLGYAFDVVVKHISTSTELIGKHTGEVSEKFLVSNRKENSDVVIELTVNIDEYSNFNMISSDVEFEQNDISNITLKIPVKKDSEREIKFKFKIDNK